MPQPIWSDLSAYEPINQSGFIVVPTVVPVDDAAISDADIEFLTEQVNEQAIVIGQARHIARHEVTSIISNKPRRPGEDATPEELENYAADLKEWERLNSSSDQLLLAEQEIFSFGQLVVIAESAAGAAVEIAKNALLSQNYLALEVGTWEYWCEQALLEVQRRSAATKRELASSTFSDLRRQITYALPALVSQLKLAPVISDTGKVIDVDYIAANPEMLKEIGPLAKGLVHRIEEGDPEARQNFDKLVAAYADLSRKELREFVKDKSRNQYTPKKEKIQAQKQTYKVVDSDTGEVSWQVTYIIPAATAYDQRWVEVQLSANYEFEEVYASA
jgi:hypothetical protein